MLKTRKIELLDISQINELIIKMDLNKKNFVLEFTESGQNLNINNDINNNKLFGSKENEPMVWSPLPTPPEETGPSPEQTVNSFDNTLPDQNNKVIINSFTDKGTKYVCDMDNITCTCPDFVHRKRICKHLKKAGVN